MGDPHKPPPPPPRPGDVMVPTRIRELRLGERFADLWEQTLQRVDRALDLIEKEQEHD